ncbi:MAG: SusD/RagB family nutrient-binding outer membrane lipoprotein [Bacteroidota bacterium]
MRKSIALLLLVGLFWGCDDFGNMNDDPNNPSAAQTAQLMTQAQTYVGTMTGTVTGTLYAQYFAETQYTDASNYASSTFDFTDWYVEPLANLQRIIDLNSDAETAQDVLAGGATENQLAAARIMKAYFFHMMTDRWGHIPYSDALKGNESLRPSYDSQADIYADLLTELSEAVDQIDTNATGMQGDILFGGNMAEWAAFANSLRMRIALRMADVDGTTAQSEFEAAVNDPNGYISGDVLYPFLAESANQNPWYARFITRTDYALSDVMADTMKAFNDYRVLKYGDPAPDEDDGNGVADDFSEIVGMPYGVPGSVAGGITNASISFPGQAVRAQDAPLPMITMAEVHFMLAEAIERGWSVPGTAAQHYEDAIQASWEQWGVYDATNFTNYMAQGDIAYSSADWQEKIGYQKWIALFPQGYEAWAEWRRLDYPELEAASAALNQSGEIPVRHGYPPAEAELNSESYEAAVEAQGGLPTGLDTKLWWDVN